MANGFRDMGAGMVMALAGHARRPAGRSRPRRAGSPSSGERPERPAGRRRGARRSSTCSLTRSTSAPTGRRASRTRPIVSLGHPWFTHYLLRFDGQPAAVARRATFDGLSYLSSIGTASWARGRGFGRLVTEAATARRDCGLGSDVDLSRGLRRQPGRDPPLRGARVRAGRATPCPTSCWCDRRRSRCPSVSTRSCSRTEALAPSGSRDARCARVGDRRARAGGRRARGRAADPGRPVRRGRRRRAPRRAMPRRRERSLRGWLGRSSCSSRRRKAGWPRRWRAHGEGPAAIWLAVEDLSTSAAVGTRRRTLPRHQREPGRSASSA